MGQAGPGGRIFRLHPNPHPEQPRVFGVHAAPDGTIWYGCGRDLCRLENGKAVPLPEGTLPRDRWDGILTDGEGTLWVRSTSRLAARSRGESRFRPLEAGLPEVSGFGRLSLARDGRLFVPTNRGLAYRHGAGWRLVGKANGLPNDAVSCLLVDAEGSLWIGMLGEGLFRWLGYPRWEAWTEAEGLPGDKIWAVTRDTRGSPGGTKDSGGG